jgi:hypothetical protein
VSLVDGVTRRISWPTTRLSVCRPTGADFDLVLVRGIEPNMRWRSFCDELLEIVRELGIRTVVTLGALLSDSPHTRPTPVTGTSYDADSATRYGLERSRYEGPTGIVGVLQDACVNAGIPAISFWAAVPHYVAQPPNPKATIALLHRVEEVLDIAVPLGELPAQADEWQKLVDEMAEEDEDVQEYIRNLEERDDSGELRETSGDVIAKEFERYLGAEIRAAHQGRCRFPGTAFGQRFRRRSVARLDSGNTLLIQPITTKLSAHCRRRLDQPSTGTG